MCVRNSKRHDLLYLALFVTLIATTLNPKYTRKANNSGTTFRPINAKVFLFCQKNKNKMNIYLIKTCAWHA